MRALVTVPHTGTRYVVACVRAAGELAVDGDEWNGRFNVMPFMHFHSHKIPPPELCVTTLRPPIEVLASHDQDRKDGRLPRVIKTMLKRCFERQLDYIDRGARSAWLSDGIARIGQLLEVAAEESPMVGSRSYPLKDALAARQLDPSQWRIPDLLEWWLDEMEHVDARYAQLNCDVWWR